MPQQTLDQDALQQRLNSLMTLVDVTCELAAQHDLDQVLRTVTTGASEALGCERATLYLYDERRRELFTHVATELEIREIRQSVDSGITGWVARHRQIANVPDPRADERWNADIDRKTGFYTRNVLAAPVVSAHDDRLLGVLQLLNQPDTPFDEFHEQVLQAFASHAATALERSQLLEQARQSKELQVAVDMGRRIQSRFLPSRLPEVPGYEVSAWWEPAEAVSGDYYDLLWLPDGRLGLIVADVSGHGFGPSLIMASVRAMLHVLARTHSEPDRILSLLCETIAPDLQEGRFITLFMGALDPQTHEFTFANAGHGPVLLLRRETGQFRQLESTGLPVGFCSDAHIPTGSRLTIEPGDLLLLATDGAIEVRDCDGEMYGRERLQRLIAKNRTAPAPELLSILRDSIMNICPVRHPPDDITLLVLERKLH